MPRIRLVALWCLATIMLCRPMTGQDTVAVHAPDTLALIARADSAEGLRLFLDCHVGGCDFDYLRTEITWVNYVRDRTASQVHVIATSIATGGGGSEVTLNFAGEREFAGVNDEFRYNTARGATSDELRQQLAHALKLGLVHYAMRTRFARDLAVNFTGTVGMRSQQAPRDPWNFWVFGAGLSGYLNGESQSTSRGGSGSFSASRTTADWKFRANMYGSTDHSSYELDDSTTLIADSHSYYGSALLVRSVSGHLSLGGTVSASASTRNNIERSLRAAPAVEYDFLRYDQYSRRRLVLSYTLGLDSYRYIDTTVFNRIREDRLDQQLSLSYATTQPWGSANVGISGSDYLSDLSQNRFSLYTGLSVRVAKGLQVGYSLSYSRVRDQLSLVRDGASDADILLRLRQLATSYTYSGNFSLSYTFGSLFNNVVNPRMGP